MARFVNYPLRTPEARWCASLESVKVDLLGVVELCDLLDGISFDDMRSFTLWEPLWSAAVVRYARCFSPGAREFLDHELLASAPAEIASLHEYVMLVRNKHVAHSQNWFEETDVTVSVREDDGVIVSIGSGHHAVVGLSSDMPGRVRGLAQWVLAEVEARIQIERPKLLALALELGVERIRSFGPFGAASKVSDGTPGRARNKP